MGIPRLTHHLEAHATKILLSHGSRGSPRDLIIDGPALAHHVYSCLIRRTAHNAFEAIPSYQELSHAVIAWLGEIEQYGVTVKAIFFDGLLPEDKKPVRLSRLQQSANQIVNFRAAYRDDLPSRRSNTITASTTTMSPTNRTATSHTTTAQPSATSGATASARDVLSLSPTSSRALSAAPFIVPLVAEALFLSSYESITSVVPGEADAYCAETARTSTSCTILTSDSDLLVHDLGKEGRVILFKDLEMLHIANKGKVLRALEYHPAAIAAKLDLPDLVQAAFHLYEDPHRGLKEAIRLAKEQSPVGPDWGTFKVLYGALPVHSTLAQRHALASGLLSRLDARTSEVVHQIRLDETIPPRSIDSYLPFIHDDPTKTSAWRAGASIRGMAYSLLASLDPSISQIDEYERKGTRIGSTAIPIQTKDRLGVDLGNLSDKLCTSHQRYSKLSDASRWRAFAADTVYELCLDNLKALPLDKEATTLVLRPRSGALTWTMIHTTAQVQAVLWSLRMLRQILAVILSIQDACKLAVPEDLKQSLQQLKSNLASLPGIAEVLEGSDDPDASEEAWQSVYNRLRSLGDRNDGEEPEVKAKKRRKKAVEPKEAKWNKSSNPFAALIE